MRFATLGILLMGLWAFAGAFLEDGTETGHGQFSKIIDDIKSGKDTTTPAGLPLGADKKNLINTLPGNTSFAAPSAPAVAVAPAFVYVTGSRVNLRASAGTDFKKLGGFDKGAKLILLQDTGGTDGWSKVSGQISGTPVTGWMASRYVSLTPPAASGKPTSKPKRSVAVPTSREITRARKDLIQQSIANYSGNCPCPYNRDRGGRKCGKRSAWSKPGGYAPLCYDSDVSRSRLTAYFSRQGKVFP